MRAMMLVVLLTLTGCATALAAEQLAGFDGVAWGSSVSAVNVKAGAASKLRVLHGGRIKVLRVHGDPEKRVFGSTSYKKEFVFCSGYGLCAGSLTIDTTTGTSAYSHAAVRSAVDDMVVEKYGVKDSDGDLKILGGEIRFTESVERGAHCPISSLMVKYLSEEYLTRAGKSKAKRAKIMDRGKVAGEVEL